MIRRYGGVRELNSSPVQRPDRSPLQCTSPVAVPIMHLLADRRLYRRTPFAIYIPFPLDSDTLSKGDAEQAFDEVKGSTGGQREEEGVRAAGLRVEVFVQDGEGARMVDGVSRVCRAT